MAVTGYKFANLSLSFSLQTSSVLFPDAPKGAFLNLASVQCECSVHKGWVSEIKRQDVGVSVQRGFSQSIDIVERETEIHWVSQSALSIKSY